MDTQQMPVIIIKSQPLQDEKNPTEEGDITYLLVRI